MFDINDYYKHITLYLDNMKNIRKHTIDKEVELFWKDYISSNIDNLHCINLKIEQKLAYSILYEIKDNKLFLINYAFNVNFKKYAPGKLLLICNPLQKLHFQVLHKIEMHLEIFQQQHLE